MAVKLRLQRTGRKNKHQFRIVAADTRSPRDGKFIEILGWYHPHRDNDSNCHVKTERVDHWLSVGAQISPSVNQLVKKFKRNGTPASA